MDDKRYIVIRPIKLYGGGEIPVNSSVYEIHGCFYMDGGLLPKDYQEDFYELIKYEKKHGWHYLKPNDPVVGKSEI